MSRLLLTGASGGLGYHLLIHPEAPHHDIDALVREETDTDRLRGLGVKQCLPWGQLGEADLSGYDHVIHAAAYVHQSEQAGGYTANHMRVNRDLTARLGQAALEAGVPHFVFISTVAVYGRFRRGMVDERSRSAPDDPYGASKREAELALAQLYGSAPGKGCTSLRLPMVYGPLVAGNFRTLLSSAARGRSLPLGEAGALRSFLYARNFSDAVYALLRAGKPPHEGMRYYLLTDQADRNSKQLYRVLFQLFHGAGGTFSMPPVLLRGAGWAGSLAEKVLRRPMPFSSRMYSRLFDEYRCDAGAFTRDIGWTPAYTPEQGMEETVAWYKEQETATL